MESLLSSEEQVVLMREAIAEAARGAGEGEAPIGAVIARRDGGEVQIVSRGRNLGGFRGQSIAHAEMVAFEGLVGPQSGELILVTTLEPCLMCFGAALVCGIAEIVFAQAAVGDFGATCLSLPPEGLYKPPIITPGILAAECDQLWREWIANRSDQDLTFVNRLLGYQNP